MITNKIKTAIFSIATMAIATFGLAACDKNTEPGETNVERSDIVEEGEIIEDEGQNVLSDTTDPERHYDHADHENHQDNEGKVLGDGAYDGKGKGVERDEVQ